LSCSAVRYRVSAIVFDLDGVLVDSMPAIRSYWVGWAQRRGIPPEEVLASIHLTAEELVRKFAPMLDAKTEARATAVGQAQIETGIAAFEGTRELVAGLPRGVWAVVTSARRELAVRHLELAGLPNPEVLVTAEDTPRGKPDPAGYQLAAAYLGVSPTRCLAVEDSPAGIRAARDAGMTVLAVTNTHVRKDLVEADTIIASLAALRLTTDPNGEGEVVVSTEGLFPERKTPR
jgi:sugar-phosphatase